MQDGREALSALRTVSAATHHITPSTLLGAAHELYGVTPIGVLISIVGASFDYGSELSLQLSAALPMITNSVHEIIFANAGASIQEERTQA